MIYLFNKQWFDLFNLTNSDSWDCWKQDSHYVVFMVKANILVSFQVRLSFKENTIVFIDIVMRF